jgi:ABC-type Zn uptake system ZnuABC Zn-binding protein ZnuA
MNRFTLLMLTMALNFFNALQASPLKICVSTPELGDLSQLIGGDQVEISIFVNGQEDAHALIAKPSDVLKLSRADGFIVMGLALEQGWAPALIERAKNSSIRPGSRGYLDASKVITPIYPKNSNVITRAMGDVHPEGNPHYMLDPVNGLKVAKVIAQFLSELQPLSQKNFQNNLHSFEKMWANKAFGPHLPQRYPLDKLIELQTLGKLVLFLNSTGEMDLFGGWFGKMEAIRDTYLVADHNQWDYFAKRFGLNIDMALEPKPGVPPGSRHLNTVIEWIQAHKVPAVLASPYFSPRTFEFIQKHSGVSILEMAHQVGARAKADSYFNMMDYNITTLCECCSKG